MNSFRFFIPAFFILILLWDCGEKNNLPKNKTDSSADFDDSTIVVVDSTKPKPVERDTSVVLPEPFMDSIYLLHVNGKEYQLVLSHEMPSETWRGDLSTTVRIVANPSHDTLYKKVFDFNMAGVNSNPAPGHYWIDLFNSGGGSGFSGVIFNIKIASSISLQPLAEFDELTYWKSNRTATEFILVHGIWNMEGINGPDPEYHYSEHKQDVMICKIEEDSVIVRDLGITKHKLDFSENDNPLPEFRKKEPALAKQIHWEDYDL